MAKPTESPGVIIGDAVYTLDEFKKRLGLGGWALRTARRRGLPVIRVGGRGYILGRDFIDYMERLKESESTPDSSGEQNRARG